jgi:hypothetical protein
MSSARRDFRPTALGDAKSRDRCTPKIEDEYDDEYQNDSSASPQIRSFVVCHSSLALLTITPISNDSVHREADAGVGGDFVLRG